MSEIKFDLSQYYPIKAVFEEILGRNAFLKVKDYGSLQQWKKNYADLFRSIGVSIAATVEVVDDDWRTNISELLKNGTDRIKAIKSIDELHASAAATLGELVFLQLGFVPRRGRLEQVPLIAKNWNLAHVRTVQYVQTKEQIMNQGKIRAARLKAVQK